MAEVSLHQKSLYEWIALLRPVHSYDAAQLILAAIKEYPGVDWREADIEVLAKALTAYAMISAEETEQTLLRTGYRQ
jgi:hypothetical protein